MLELCGQGFVACHGSPIIRQDLRLWSTQIDHRLNRKEHAGFQYSACTGFAIVQNIGRRVEDTAQTVTAEVAHNRHAVALYIGLNCRANVAERITWLYSLDSFEQSVMGDLQ